MKRLRMDEIVWPVDASRRADQELQRCEQRRMEIAKLAIAWAKQTGDPILQNAESVALFEAVNALFAVEGKVSE